ncbi:MAG TPA: HlyD family secretion protein [Pseudomonadales bacterium]|jgi:multidrug resistance efflux pump
MSEQDHESEKAAEAQPESATAEKAVKRGGQMIGLVIVVTLVWYLLADRYTPYTTQARVQGYVIGVAPKVSGLVTQVWAQNNREVQQGERLFEIDRSEYQIAVGKARSDLENARRQVEAGRAAVEASRANLAAALANRVRAEKDYDRLQRLHSRDPGTISTRRLEMSRASLDQAVAAVSAAESNVQAAIEQMGGEDEASNAILQSAQSAVARAELDLSNTIVTASSRGVITDLRADVGQFAGAGSAVMTLIAVHDLWISAEFTENNLGHMRSGTEVEILFDVVPGRVFSGRIRSLGLGVSAGQSHPPGTLPTIQNNRDWLRQSQRFAVIVDFDPNQHGELRSQLRIGGQASVMGLTEGHGVLNLLGQLYMRIMSWLSYAY